VTTCGALPLVGGVQRAVSKAGDEVCTLYDCLVATVRKAVTSWRIPVRGRQSEVQNTSPAETAGLESRAEAPRARSRQRAPARYQTVVASLVTLKIAGVGNV